MRYYFIITAVFLLILPSFVFAASVDPAQLQAGYEAQSTGNWYETDPFSMGKSGANFFNGGVVFENVEIPAGSTITGATLSFYWHTNFQCTNIVNVTVYGIAADNFAAFSNSDRPSNSPQTTNNNYYADACFAGVFNGGQTIFFDNINSIVQEIIDRSGWASGNNMAFALMPTTAVTAFFNHYIADEFALDIDFTPPPDNTMLNCTPPANDDISIITGCKNIYASTTSSSTITGIETFSYYSPAILLLYIFIIILLIAIVFAVWILRHDLH